MNHRPDPVKTDLTNISIIVSAFFAIILFAKIYTLYPIDDDWSYIKAAETFFNTGKLQFTPWTSPSLVFQIMWGALFSWFFGFSVNTLILSTQIISCLGMVFFYLLLRQTGCRSLKALFLTLLLIFNPYSFPLLYTFFTDQHFIALMLISTYFYYRGMKRQETLALFAGSIAASLSVLIRQPGLLIALSAGIYLLLTRKGPVRIIASCILPLITFCIFTYWLQYIHGQTLTAKLQMEWIIECLGSPVYIISKLFNRPVIILDLFGFCLIPFSLAILPEFKNRISIQKTPLAVLFCLAGIIFYLLQDHIGITSSIYNWKNGFHFAYVSEYGFRGASNSLLFFYKFLDFTAVFSITLIAWAVIKKRRVISSLTDSPFLFLMLIPLLQFMFLMIVRYKFTRYYLVLLPFFILVVNRIIPDVKITKRYFLPLLAGFIVFSICITQDFLSWNQAHWELGKKALQQDIPVRKISGGFPWDCWHNMDYCQNNPYEIVPRSYDIPWWLDIMTPAIDPQYLISNSPVPTGFYMFKYFYLQPYKTLAVKKYYSLLYRKKMSIFLLKRQPPAKVPTMAGETYYSFADNLAGAIISSEKNDHDLEKTIAEKDIDINNITRHCIVQPSNTRIKFKLALPPQNCRLRFFLATDPDTWHSGGDGITFKIMLSNNLFENLFDSIGMAGETEKLAFFKPRGFFLNSHPIYINYINPKISKKQKKWNAINLDMSRFSGKVVNIELVAEPGPVSNDMADIALWGDPVIETY